jgi:hypothetical protein
MECLECKKRSIADLWNKACYPAICIRDLMMLQSLGAPSTAIAFFRMFSYFYFIPTKCFGPYGPTSGGIYILVNFQVAIYATTDPKN